MPINTPNPAMKNPRSRMTLFVILNCLPLFLPPFGTQFIIPSAPDKVAGRMPGKNPPP